MYAEDCQQSQKIVTKTYSVLQKAKNIKIQSSLAVYI